MVLLLAGYYTPASTGTQVWLPLLAAGLVSAALMRHCPSRLLLLSASFMAGAWLSAASVNPGAVSGSGTWLFRVETTTTAGALLELEGNSVWASHRELASRCSRNDSVLVMGSIHGSFMQVAAFSPRPSSRLPDRIRRSVSMILMEGTGSRVAGSLASALLTGERGRVPGTVRDLFRSSGTSHLLALSGLHVGLVSAVSLLLLRFIAGRGWVSLLLSTLIIGTYVLIAGARPSTVRAFIMIVSVMVLWQFSGKLPHLLFAWTVALLILVVSSGGGILRDAGAQMSFAAVLSLIILGRRFEGRAGWLLSAIYAGLVATVALAPLVSSVYGGFNPSAPLATALSIPLMVMLMAGGIMVLLVPPLSGAFSLLAQWSAWIWLEVLGFLGTEEIGFENWMVPLWVTVIATLWLFSRRGGYLRRFL